MPIYFLFIQIVRKGIQRGRQVLPPQAVAGPHLSLPRVLQLHQDPAQADQLGRGEGDSRPGEFLDLILTSERPHYLTSSPTPGISHARAAQEQAEPADAGGGGGGAAQAGRHIPPRGVPGQQAGGGPQAAPAAAVHRGLGGQGTGEKDIIIWI